MDFIKHLLELRGTLHPSLTVPIQFCAFNCLWTYVAAEWTGNYSQVDRIWTFLPVMYTGWFTFYPLMGSADASVKAGGVRPRAALMLGLQVVWMLRLSYNTLRRGLFSFTEEDYRWPVFRRNVPVWFAKVFNLLFIAITQNILLLGLGLPAYATLTTAPMSLTTSDLVLAGLSITTLLTQFTADNQQYAYQSFKHNNSGDAAAGAWPGARLKFTEADRKRGFVTRGLWAWARHPNFACEQTFWFLMNLFPVLASPKLIPRTIDHPTRFAALLPSLALSLLFVASTRMTEAISTHKYPEAYGAYKQRVGMFSPVLTVLKGAWLGLRGKKGAVECMVWGAGPVLVDGDKKTT